MCNASNWYRADDRGPGRDGVLEPTLHLRRAGHRDRRRGRIDSSARRSAWFSSSRFSASVSTISWAPWPGDLVVPVRDVLVDRDRRERRRVDLVGHPVEDLGRVERDEPAGRRAGDDDAGPDDEDRDDEQPDPGGAADERRRRARHRSPAGVANRPISSAADRGSGTSRSRIGRAAQTTTRPASSPTLVPNSSVCGASRSVLATPTRRPNTTRPTRPAGTVLGSVIMKNRKIRTSGEVTITRQKSKPQTGANAQFAVMQWPEPARRPTPTARVDPERRREGEEVQPPRDQQPADDDDGVGRDHPDVQRRPPEVERLDPRAAEDDERDDQPDVGRVEHVRTAVADDVLRQEREAGDDREHVPGVRVPRVVRRRPDDAQDEGDAAAGQHRARRPDERAGLPEGQDDLDDRAGQDRREDLRHAHLEVQPDLPEDVDRDDDRGDMQPRIADVRQDQRVACSRRT